MHAGLRPSDMTRKVTICGATGGQGAAMALIMHFLRGQHTEHPQFDLTKIVFSGDVSTSSNAPRPKKREY